MMRLRRQPKTHLPRSSTPSPSWLRWQRCSRAYEAAWRSTCGSTLGHMGASAGWAGRSAGARGSSVEELAGWFLLIIAAIAAILFAIWVAVAAIVRVFAWVLVFWIATFAAGLVVGILAGVVLPPRVLRGKAADKPEIATPDAVVAGKVLGDAPKGQAKHFGWDRAWPVYNPHQAKRDADAVLAQAKRTVKSAFGWLFDMDPP